MFFTKKDVLDAISIIETKYNFKFKDIPNIDNYFLSGQALSSALLFKIGVIPDFFINDIDLFKFEAVSSKDYDLTSQSSKSKIRYDNRYLIEKKFSHEIKLSEDEVSCRAIELSMKIACKSKNKKELIELYPEYYGSVFINSAINSACHYYQELTNSKLKNFDGSLVFAADNVEHLNSVLLSSQSNIIEIYSSISTRILPTIKKYIKSINYKNEKFIEFSKIHSNVNKIRIESSKNDGILNFITYKMPYFHNLDKILFLKNFDFNMVQIGYDFSNNKVYYTNEFLEFIKTKNLKTTSISTSSQTAIRLFKKTNEFKPLGIHSDLDLESQIINQTLLFNNADYWNKFDIPFSKENDLSLILPYSEIYRKRIADNLSSYFDEHKFIINKNKNVKLYHLKGKTIDSLDIVDKFVFDFKLNTKNNSNSKSNSNISYFPHILSSYLKVNISKMAYREKYESKSKSTLFTFSDNNIHKSKVLLEGIFDNPYASNTNFLSYFDILIKNINVKNVEVLLNKIKKINNHDRLIKKIASFVNENSIYFSDVKDIINLIDIFLELKSYTIGYVEEEKNFFHNLYLSNKNKEEVLLLIKNKLMASQRKIEKTKGKKVNLLNDFEYAKVNDTEFFYCDNGLKVMTEGDEMKHCVGGMSNIINNQIIFSAKTKNNDRLTFNFSMTGKNLSFGQCQGINNKRKYVSEKTLNNTMIFIFALKIFLEKTYNINLKTDNYIFRYVFSNRVDESFSENFGTNNQDEINKVYNEYFKNFENK